ncbi:hypothetical protein Aduo_015024 [Ancylostoma duodenale]
MNRRKTEPKRRSYHYAAKRERAASMYTVSSDILRVSGYTQQFRSLLTARFSPRRESVPNVHLETEHEEKGYSIIDRALLSIFVGYCVFERDLKRRDGGKDGFSVFATALA